MPIDRCVCSNQPFAAIKKAAGHRADPTISDLQGLLPFGENCQLCHPYIRRMLRTGEIQFTSLVLETDEPPED